MIENLRMDLYRFFKNINVEKKGILFKSSVAIDLENFNTSLMNQVNQPVLPMSLSSLTAHTFGFV